MFKDADLINVYSDYDYTIYVPNVNKLEGDYVLKPKIDGEPYYIPVLWRDIVNANRISNRIKAREIRFEGDIEAEAYKQLRIDLVREKDTYTREQIETMILNHFLQRRIGFETVTAFRIQLDVKLNEIMPLYNKMFDALENWEIFNDGEVTTRTGKDNRTSESTNIAQAQTTDRSILVYR